jgi:hypothetical protein
MVVISKYVVIKSLECVIDITKLGCIGSLEGVESLGQGLLTLFRGVFPRHGHKEEEIGGKVSWLEENTLETRPVNQLN